MIEKASQRNRICSLTIAASLQANNVIHKHTKNKTTLNVNIYYKRDKNRVETAIHQ